MQRRECIEMLPWRERSRLSAPSLRLELVPLPVLLLAIREGALRLPLFPAPPERHAHLTAAGFEAGLHRVERLEVDGLLVVHRPALMADAGAGHLYGSLGAGRLGGGSRRHSRAGGQPENGNGAPQGEAMLTSPGVHGAPPLRALD